MKTLASHRLVEILLVEDNPGDQELTVMALMDGKLSNNVSAVEDGIEALAFLRQEDPYQDAPRPDLILLDLNLPRKDGRETLAEIKADPNLGDIPIVILTTSESDLDIAECYKLRANCYIKKPVELNEFMEVVRSVEDFWFTIVKLPAR